MENLVKELSKDFINWHIAYCTIAPFVFVGGVAAVFLKEPDSASQNKETSNLPIFKRFIRSKNIIAFKRAFRSVDVLMVDDVQFISGKDSTQARCDPAIHRYQ